MSQLHGASRGGIREAPGVPVDVLRLAIQEAGTALHSPAERRAANPGTAALVAVGCPRWVSNPHWDPFKGYCRASALSAASKWTSPARGQAPRCRSSGCGERGRGGQPERSWSCRRRAEAGRHGRAASRGRCEQISGLCSGGADLSGERVRSAHQRPVTLRGGGGQTVAELGDVGLMGQGSQYGVQGA